MLTKIDFKKLEKVFVTKQDLKKELKKYATKKDISRMSDDIIEVVSTLGEKFDEFTKKINSNDESLENHERRLDTLEDKVFTSTTNS